MDCIPMEVPVTEDNVEESAYLLANPDVVQQIAAGNVKSVWDHFQRVGLPQGRPIRMPSDRLAQAKAEKLRRIEPALRTDLPRTELAVSVGYLTEELREKFNIVDTDSVSATPTRSAPTTTTRSSWVSWNATPTGWCWTAAPGCAGPTTPTS